MRIVDSLGIPRSITYNQHKNTNNHQMKCTFHNKQTSIQRPLFQDNLALPDTKPTASKHWRQNLQPAKTDKWLL